MIRRAPVPSRQRLEFGWFIAVASALAAILIWVFWVMPVSRSIEESTPVAIGKSVEYDAVKGKPVAIWTSGHVSWLGTATCTAEGSDGAMASVHTVTGLSWDDTLWWQTPRSGFEQTRWFTATSSGKYTIKCEDALDTYEGEFLVAKSAVGTGSLGLGRGGGVSYSIAEILALTSVLAPLLAVLLVPIMAIQTLRFRRSQRER